MKWKQIIKGKKDDIIDKQIVKSLWIYNTYKGKHHQSNSLWIKIAAQAFLHRKYMYNVNASIEAHVKWLGKCLVLYNYLVWVGSMRYI